jgi:probable F420-dependent oxidoreductase
VRFGISIPQFAPDGEFDPGAFRAFLQQAEELGFEGAWTQEHTFGTAPMLSPLETLTYAAACTRELRLGCAVFVAPQRNPVELARSVTSLDQMSRGRVEIGLGVGGGHGLAAFGVTPDTRAARLTEGLALMKACWTEPEITFEGRFWQLEGATVEPKPFQKPHPPVWIGGSHPNALRRAVRLGDGFFGAGSRTTAVFADQVQTIRAELAARGRDPGAFRIAKRVYLTIDDDRARARRRMDEALERLYGTDTLSPVAVCGTPDDCIEGLGAVARAGAEMILCNVLFDEAAQMERLTAEVLPAVRTLLRTG